MLACCEDVNAARRWTYCSADSQVGRAMRVLGPAWPSLRVVGLGKAGVGVRRVCPHPIGIIVGATQAVLGGILDAPVLVQTERRVGKGAVNDTTVLRGAEAQLVGTKDGGVGNRSAGIRVELLVPVGLSASVVALLLEKLLVHSHVKPVPRQKVADAVDDVGLSDVHPVKFIPSRDSAIDDSSLGGRCDQAFLGAEVLGFFITCQSVPVLLKYLISFYVFLGN